MTAAVLVWQEPMGYGVDSWGDGQTLATDDQLLPQGSALDWQVWQPSTGLDQELQTESAY